MKKINLLFAVAALGLTVQTTFAQSIDTSKNKVEVKKKVKVGVNGRQVTKIKMESKGTPGTVSSAVDGTVNTNPKVATPAPTANPTVVVVQPEPAVKASSSTVAAVKTPVTSTRTTTTTATSRRVSSSKVVPRKTTRTTTTTVKQ